ncbi:MAG: putative ABC transport system permease protein [Phormidesmis priestleyi Ana]|uniref:Putative ABC transport system permease protein n=1 Tax=Phormidesmis priestleyi Ana TaxID=1666911 RepID=A0A0P7YWX2_9CYAN|nr:MAG: putative ABC transport system permease protein [Phormidesmis priestleyi Ana]
MVKADRRITKRISRFWKPASRPEKALPAAKPVKDVPLQKDFPRLTQKQAQRHSPGLEADNPIYHSAMAVLLAGQVMHRLVQGRYGQRQIMDHLMCAGPRCLAPVVMTNLCAGIIFAIQSAREMARFGSISSLGGIFAAAFCRELAPLLTAGVLACQVGSAFAAEIASMKLTDQIDALKMLRTDPIDYLVMPRVIACAIMLPILTLLALFCGVAGGGLITTQVYELSRASFLDGVRTYLTVSDVLFITAKAILFGGVIAVASCSRGLTAALHGKGVGESATSAVVTSWLALFVIDLLFAGVSLFQLM